MCGKYFPEQKRKEMGCIIQDRGTGTFPSDQEPCVHCCILHCQTSFWIHPKTVRYRVRYWMLLRHTSIRVVKDRLKDIRKNAKTLFSSSVYEKMKKMAKIADKDDYPPHLW